MIIKNVNPNKLHDELIKAGITPILLTNDKIKGETTAKNTYITFADDFDMTAVQRVISKHNPEPLPIPLTEKQQRLLDLETAMTQILGGTV